MDWEQPHPGREWISGDLTMREWGKSIGMTLESGWGKVEDEMRKKRAKKKCGGTVRDQECESRMMSGRVMEGVGEMRQRAHWRRSKSWGEKGVL